MRSLLMRAIAFRFLTALSSVVTFLHEQAQLAIWDCQDALSR